MSALDVFCAECNSAVYDETPAVLVVAAAPIAEDYCSQQCQKVHLLLLRLWRYHTSCHIVRRRNSVEIYRGSQASCKIHRRVEQ